MRGGVQGRAVRAAACAVMLAPALLGGCGCADPPEPEPDAGEMCRRMMIERDACGDPTTLVGLDGEPYPSDWFLSGAPDGAARLGVQRTEAVAMALARDGTVTAQEPMMFGTGFGGPIWGTWSAVARVTPRGGSERGPLLLLWKDVLHSSVLLNIEIDSRLPGVRGCGVDVGDMAVTPDDSALWVFRPACAPEDGDEWVRLHIFTAGGHEPLGPAGLPIERRPFARTIAATEDGSVWYLTDRTGPGIDEARRFGVRAVRRGPDGEVEAISPLLADPDVVGFHEPEHVSYVFGWWGEAADDGAYLAHFVGFAPGRGSYTSYISRVEPDGTLAWTVRPPTYLVAGYGAQWRDVAIDEAEGGVVAVIGYNDYTNLRRWRVTAEGELPWGEEGREIAPARGPFGDVGIVSDIEAADDRHGGMFVARWVDDPEDPREDVRGVVHRFASTGMPLWDESGAEATCAAEGYPTLLLAPDGDGGVWVLGLESFAGTGVQHFDAYGRPLFYLAKECCEEDLPAAVCDYQYDLIHDRPPLDGGAPEDGGPPDAGMMTADGGPADAGTRPPDAGVPDASDADAGTVTDGAAEADAGGDAGTTDGSASDAG